MNELIYADYKVEKIIKEKYPNAKIEDASDWIHENRFEVNINIPFIEFAIFACKEGFAEVCLSLTLKINQDNDFYKELKERLKKEAKQ